MMGERTKITHIRKMYNKEALFENWRYAQRRGIFSSGKVDMTQEYLKYFKENRQSMAGKRPPIGRVDNFQTSLKSTKVDGKRFSVTARREFAGIIVFISKNHNAVAAEKIRQPPKAIYSVLLK